MAALEKNIFKKVKKKPNIRRRYIDDMFLICEHDEQSLKECINEINLFHPIKKFEVD